MGSGFMGQKPLQFRRRIGDDGSGRNGMSGALKKLTYERTADIGFQCPRVTARDNMAQCGVRCTGGPVFGETHGGEGLSGSSVYHRGGS